VTCVHRPVAASELGFVGPPATTVAYEATLRGRLDVEALGAAFEALRHEHPELDACVRPAETGAAFGDGGRAEFVVEAVDALPDEVDVVLDPLRTLARLHVTSAGDRHRVILATNHALTDGTYLIALFNRLWSAYREAVSTGTVVRRPVQQFPGSSESVVAERGISVGSDTGRDRLAGSRWFGAFPVGIPTGPCLPDVTSLRFPAETTAGLLAAASAGPGIHALLAGILLSAERAGFVDDPADTPIRIGAMSLVDLRGRLGGTPIPPTAVTNFVGASFAGVEVTDIDPVRHPDRAREAALSIGATVASAVRADRAAGRCLTAMVGPQPPAEQPTGPQEPPITLSNLGALHIDVPPALALEDLRPRMTGDSALLHLPPGPDGTAPRLPSPLATIFQAFTIGDRLGIEAVTLGDSTTAAARTAVADRITSLVQSFAG
jgi:hypothetical protein